MGSGLIILFIELVNSLILLFISLFCFTIDSWELIGIGFDILVWWLNMFFLIVPYSLLLSANPSVFMALYPYFPIILS